MDSDCLNKLIILLLLIFFSILSYKRNFDDVFKFKVSFNKGIRAQVMWNEIGSIFFNYGDLILCH